GRHAGAIGAGHGDENAVGYQGGGSLPAGRAGRRILAAGSALGGGWGGGGVAGRIEQEGITAGGGAEEVDEAGVVPRPGRVGTPQLARADRIRRGRELDLVVVAEAHPAIVERECHFHQNDHSSCPCPSRAVASLCRGWRTCGGCLSSSRMSHEGLHEPAELLTGGTQELHRALVSLIEELEAIDWYQQRADACGDDGLKAVLLHNRNEEVEHAMMVLEWIRRNDAKFDESAREYLFTTADITHIEAEKKAAEGGAASSMAS